MTTTTVPMAIPVTAPVLSLPVWTMSVLGGAVPMPLSVAVAAVPEVDLVNVLE